MINHGNSQHSFLLGDDLYNKRCENFDTKQKKKNAFRVWMKNETKLTDGSLVQKLMSLRPLFFLSCWYFFSMLTIVFSKYLLDELHTETTLLGTLQMSMTTILGLVQIYFPMGLYSYTTRPTGSRRENCARNMLLNGSMRYACVLLGLVALKYVAVSFTETVKSSAPLFTVFISRVMMGEHCSLATHLSLIPIVLGLALCSAYELSFNFIGFLAALLNNITDCVQNVFTKVLVSQEKHCYTPAEIQFYTSLASVALQLPACYFFMDTDLAIKCLQQPNVVLFLILNGVSFHFQCITAYSLMGFISPVTYSVANTVKRALIVWLSVLIFGNSVTLLSALGTLIIFLGVMAYNEAREREKRAALRRLGRLAAAQSTEII